jgi:hypothetical protein
VLIVPLPVTDLVTALFVVPDTVAVNCTCPPAEIVVEDGETATDTTGLTVTVPVADFEVSAWLVAVTVAVSGDEMPVGAV